MSSHNYRQKSQYAWLGVVASAICFSGSTARSGIITTRESCIKSQEPFECHLADLEDRVFRGNANDFSQTGKYKFVQTDESIELVKASGYKQRAWRRAHSVCHVTSREWVNVDVSEYEQLTGSVAVNRKRYEQCINELIDGYEHDELVRGLIKWSKKIGLAVTPIMVLLVLWYRRPLIRAFRGLARKLNAIGHK